MVSNLIWIDCRKWSDKNKVILNETKTKAILATGKWITKRMINQALDFKLNAKELEHQVNSQKLVNVKIDQNLSFDDHKKERNFI